MITINNVKNAAGVITTHTIKSDDTTTIDAKGKLTILPSLIDPHVHLRTPGAEHKENWISGSQAAIAGGVTRVFDMPNNNPACSTVNDLQKKRALIDAQLAEIKIPLRYDLYFGADSTSVEDISKVQNDIVGVKVFMGSSTGGLLMNEDSALERVFQICAQCDLIVTVHAEDEDILQARKMQFSTITDPSVHSKIRDRSAAIKATEKAISLAQKYSTQLCIAHVSTEEELDLIRDAKKHELLIYAEATPHHLFLNENDYAKWGTFVQMNPPLRLASDQEALWAAIHDGTIDFIGSDHAPHTCEEKMQPYGQTPSGVPGLETTLPLLLNAHHEGKISLRRIVELTRINIENIFNLLHNDDVVLVDLEMKRTVSNEMLKTKCGWSPFTGLSLTGWPVYTILKGKIFHV